jgi:glycosyl transferase family 25
MKQSPLPPVLPSIIVINLDRDADRLQHMSGIFSALGLAFVRHPGILGRNVPPELSGYFQKRDGVFETSLKDGEIGCYASHLSVLREVAAGRHGEAAIVMEDDLFIDDDFAATILALMPVLSAGWDMVRLSNASKRAYVDIAPLVNGRCLVKYSKIPNGTGAYLVSPEGASKILSHQVRWRAFDEDIRRPWLYGLHVFGVIEPPVAPSSMTSTIDALDPGRLAGRRSLLGRLRRVYPGESLGRLAFNIRTLGLQNWCRCCVQNAATRLRLRARKPAPIGRRSAALPRG